MTQSGSAGGLDLNLLVALDVLLEEQSVQGAAHRLHLSEPAMSRTLGRIRKALGDPVLVRAGRKMVPTPRALAVRAEVSAVVERARALFAPGRDTDLRTVSRTLTIIGHDSFPALYGARLLARAAAEAPGIRVRFLAESHVDTPYLCGRAPPTWRSGWSTRRRPRCMSRCCTRTGWSAWYGPDTLCWRGS